MKPDIQRIAREDPVYADLLQFKRFFFYQDWVLFREKKASVLIKRMKTRVKASYRIPWIILLSQLPVLIQTRGYRDNPTFWESWGYSIVAGSILLGVALAFHLGTRKKLNQQVSLLNELNERLLLTS